MPTPEIQELKKIIFSDRRENNEKLDKLTSVMTELTVAITTSNERDKMYSHRITRLEEDKERIEIKQGEILISMATIVEKTKANTESRKNTTLAIRSIGVSLVIGFVVGGVALAQAT